jgi:hypothetical protein
MNRYLKLGALAIAAIVTVACGTDKPAEETTAQRGKQISVQKSGDLTIALENESGELKMGQNRFVVSFRSANGQPVDAGKVTVSSSMAMPGMAPMVAPVELQPAGQVGTYSLTGDFAMSGAWKFEIRWDGPAGQGTTSFSTNVR